MHDEDLELIEFEKGYTSPYIYPEDNWYDNLEIESGDDFDIFDFLL